MNETANKNQKSPEFFGDKLSEYKAAVGGAAVGLATNEAKRTGGKITVEMVNKYTKRLNKIAGVIIIGYLLFIAYITFGGGDNVILSENEMAALCKAEGEMGGEPCTEARIAELQINFHRKKLLY